MMFIKHKFLPKFKYDSKKFLFLQGCFLDFIVDYTSDISKVNHLLYLLLIKFDLCIVYTLYKAKLFEKTVQKAMGLI